jgi:two-component system KDP operon response regulator KdpE
MTPPSPRVLVIEDEAHMRRFLRTTLKHNGYDIVEAVDGVQALEEVAYQPPHLILLDLGLPDIDGVELIGRIRVTSRAPLIVLSARDLEQTKIQALDVGANDYVTKPFSVGELLARIRAALRGRLPDAQDASATSGQPIQLGELIIDLTKRLVKVSDRTIHLTRTEFALLAVMARTPGMVVRHQDLLHEVWGPSTSAQVEHLRVFMRQLRYKLEREPSQPRFLLTVSGVGYRLATGD